MAIQHNIPILLAVVLGADQVLATLDKIYKTKGIRGGKIGVVAEYLKELSRISKPQIDLRFVVYNDHRLPLGLIPKDPALTERAQLHTDLIIRQHAIPLIQSVNPNYPLGYYAFPAKAETVVFQE